jgi:hypothetical protein
LGLRAGYPPPFHRLEARQDIQRRLNEIPNVTIGDAQLEKYPRVQIMALAAANAFDEFVSTIAWVLREAATAPTPG